MTMYIPVLIVVLANTIYHICAKSTPNELNTFASLTVTYAVAAVASLLLYFAIDRRPDFIGQLRQMNWTSYVLGFAVIGLEAGFLWMYKIGWDVSTAQIVQSAILAVVLVAVGYLLYREKINASKLTGIAITLVGLYLLNK